MATNTPEGVYPFSTQEGTAIPLDVIEGIGVLPVAFTAGASVAFTIPEGEVVGAITASEACVIAFGLSIGTITDNTLIDDALFIPRDATMTCALTPGLAYVRGFNTSGTIIVQFIRKWAAINLNRQYTRK